MRYKISKILSRINDTDNIKKIFKSLGFLFSEKILRIIVGFFVTAWIARYLGPESYGRYTFIIQYVLIFLPVVTFGMNELISRDIVKERSNLYEGDILGTSFVIKLINSLVGIGLILLSLPLLELSAQDKYIIIIFSSILIVNVLGVVDHWYEAKLKYKQLVFARNIGYLSGVVAKIYFLIEKDSFEYFVIAYLLEIIISKGLGLYIYYVKNGFKHWKYNKDLMKNYYKESFPLFLVSSLSILEQKIGFVFVKKINEPKILGYYSLAFTMFNILIFIPNAIVTTLFPTIIRSKVRSESLYQERILKLFFALSWSAIAFCIGFSLVGGQFITILFGEKYEASTNILKVMSILFIFVSLDAARRKILILEGHGKDYLVIITAYVLFSLAFQYYLVGVYNSIGVVYGSILAFVFSNIIISILNKKIRKVSIMFIKGFIYPVRRYFN